MKEPSFELVTPANREEGVRSLQFIERMARISHRSESRQTKDTWEPFLKAVVIGHGDWSVCEHQSATVIFRVDRGTTHELVRHRLCSFTQESTRFVRYTGDMEFIMPSGGYILAMDVAFSDAERNYKHLLDAGYTPQIARAVLPNALASTLAVTSNLRNWRWFFQARTTKEAHPDCKRVVVPLLAEFQKRIPLLYDDIVPEEKQSISMAKVH
jgi:thymidylate synthase (FAD)